MRGKTAVKAAGGFGLVTAPTAVLAFAPATEWFNKDQARLLTIGAVVWLAVSLLVLSAFWAWDRRRKAPFRRPRPALAPIRDDSASFIDYMERPDAAFAMKITAVFAQVNASRKVRARIVAWKTLRNELGAEPSKAQLDTVAQTLYDRSDTALGVTEDEIRAYLDAHGVISPEVQPWNSQGQKDAHPTLDHSTSPPAPMSDAEFVRRCNQYIFIGKQITHRVRGVALDAPGTEWSDLFERVRKYLNEVYRFFNEHRPKYWLRMAEYSDGPTTTRHVEIRIDEMIPKLTELHPGGYAEALCNQIDRAMRTLREAVDES